VVGVGATGLAGKFVAGLVRRLAAYVEVARSLVVPADVGVGFDVLQQSKLKGNNLDYDLVAACEVETSLFWLAGGDRQVNHKPEFPFPVEDIGSDSETVVEGLQLGAGMDDQHTHLVGGVDQGGVLKACDFEAGES
jgi:hypothetical protein